MSASPSLNDIDSIITEKVKKMLPSVAGLIAEQVQQAQAKANPTEPQKNTDELEVATEDCSATVNEFVDPLIKQHVQVQCLSKVMLNGRIAFVMDSIDGGRYAVYVPDTRQRISV